MDSQELREVYNYLSDYQLLLLENDVLVQYIFALRHSADTELGLANTQIANTQAAVDLVNAQLTAMTQQRDFYKGAFDTLTKKGGFWHTFKKILTLGIAR